ncbi:MAG: hypothetical protein ACLRZ9_08780 [Eubacterium sp.]
MVARVERKFNKVKFWKKETQEYHLETFNDEFSDNKLEHFSIQTEYILRDIGMYIGEMFVTNYSQIYWTFYTEPKSDFFVNQPLLLGFVDKSFIPPYQMEFEPIHMVGVKAANLFDGTEKNTDLLNLYLQWEKFVPQI